MKKIKITKTAHPLPFFRLSPTDFERLCFWVIHDSEEFDIVQHYGGMGDMGRDVIAYKGVTTPKREMWYFQCKRYKEIGFPHFKKELDNLEEHIRSNPDFRPDVVIFITGCSISAPAKTKTTEYATSKGFKMSFFGERPNWTEKQESIPKLSKCSLMLATKPFLRTYSRKRLRKK